MRNLFQEGVQTFSSPFFLAECRQNLKLLVA